MDAGSSTIPRSQDAVMGDRFRRARLGADIIAGDEGACCGQWQLWLMGEVDDRCTFLCCGTAGRVIGWISCESGCGRRFCCGGAGSVTTSGGSPHGCTRNNNGYRGLKKERETVGVDLFIDEKGPSRQAWAAQVREKQQRADKAGGPR